MLHASRTSRTVRTSQVSHREEELGEVSVSLDGLRKADRLEFAEGLPSQGSLVFEVRSGDTLLM